MLDFGMPRGPLRLTDEVGLDVSFHVGSDLAQRIQNLPPLTNTIERMIAQGWRGRKSGKGFYDNSSGAQRPNLEIHAYQPETDATGSDNTLLRDRLVLDMLNEAA